MLKCMNCGHVNAPSASGCTACDIPLDATNSTVLGQPEMGENLPRQERQSGGQPKCWNCGFTLSVGARRCPACETEAETSFSRLTENLRPQNGSLRHYYHLNN